MGEAPTRVSYCNLTTGLKSGWEKMVEPIEIDGSCYTRCSGQHFSVGGKKPWLLGQGLAHLWPKIKCRHKGHWVNSYLGHFLIVKSPIIKGLFGTLTAFWLLWKLHFVFQLWTILASGQSAKGSWWPLCTCTKAWHGGRVRLDHVWFVYVGGSS